jgi:hypothetical protein
MGKAPTALTGTSPKSDNRILVGMNAFYVGFGGGGRGLVVRRVESLRGRQAESARQGEGLFESLLALSRWTELVEVFGEGLSQSFRP